VEQVPRRQTGSCSAPAAKHASAAGFRPDPAPHLQHIRLEEDARPRRHQPRQLLNKLLLHGAPLSVTGGGGRREVRREEVRGAFIRDCSRGRCCSAGQVHGSHPARPLAQRAIRPLAPLPRAAAHLCRALKWGSGNCTQARSSGPG
jgi:hypothetical protein